MHLSQKQMLFIKAVIIHLSEVRGNVTMQLNLFCRDVVIAKGFEYE